MSLDHRERLIRIARQFDALIITDDVYDFLQWPSSHSTNARFPSQALVPRVVDVDRCRYFIDEFLLDYQAANPL
jgi:DNA-binding transcriptional MocR family regulator